MVSIEFELESQLNFYHDYARNTQGDGGQRVAIEGFDRPKNCQREKIFHGVLVSGGFGNTSCAKNFDSSELSLLSP